MTPKAIARKIIKDWMAKKGATLEGDLFVPIAAAIAQAYEASAAVAENWMGSDAFVHAVAKQKNGAAGAVEVMRGEATAIAAAIRKRADGSS